MTLQETKQYIATFHVDFSYISFQILFQAEKKTLQYLRILIVGTVPTNIRFLFLFPQSSILNLGKPCLYFCIIFSVEYADAVPLLTKLDLFSTHDSVCVVTE